MKKEIKGKKQINSKSKIKKRIPKRKNNTNNKRNENNKIKNRVTPKYTKQDKQYRTIALTLLLIAIVIVYIILGIEFAAIATFGSSVIIGIGLLLRKVKSTPKKRKLINFLIILFLTLGILAIIAFGAFFLYIKNSADPAFDKKEKELQTAELTLLYDIDGNVFKKLGTEQRTKVTYEELPEVLIDAIIATEDSRYFQHNGFDAPRFIKAAIGQVLGKSDAGGASTITMQVAKNTFSRDTDGNIATSGIDGITRKFEDIYISIFKLEEKYTKQEIIEFYVNNHFLGGNIYGVAEASEAYFGKDVSDLNLTEAAIIAGMFKSPNYYRPTTNPENAEKRRDTVLYLMEKHGYINKEERKIAASIPVESLTATYSESTDIYQGYIDTVVDEVKEKYGVNPYTTSLKIYTNLDRKKQDAVNSVFNGESYTWINDQVQSGVAVLDTHTGKILAVGNGRNIRNRGKNTIDQYNYATELKRQPGSTAKPLFDYGPGIEYNNWSTYTLFDDAPYQYSNGQSIKNWDGGYFGTITLRRALATSRNIPALKAFQQVDNKKIVEFVTNLGIEPEISGGKVHEAHSIGAFTGVSPLQMAAAYSAFSNGGYYNEPYSVQKIVYRATGEEKEHTDENYIIKRRAMSEETAFMIADVLQDVALNGGTPKNVAVKTGTTNYDIETMKKNNLPDDAIRDSWAVGFSTKTAIAMWYGYDYIDSEYCLHNFPASREKDYLYRALINSGAMESNRADFSEPSGVVKVAIAAGSNPPKLAGSGTSQIIHEYFKKDYVPTEIDEGPIPAPSNFSVTYNKILNKVSMNWNAVSPGGHAKDNYGKFGYNIYKDGVLLDWTSKTSYSYKTTSPYGTYKIVGTYKSFNGVQSQEATFTLKEEKEPEKPKETQTPSTSPSNDPTTPSDSPSPVPSDTPENPETPNSSETE